MMRILIFGAGVIGTIYGAKLAEAGHDVTLLARGDRKVYLETEGLRLVNVLTGAKTNLHLKVIDTPVGDFDLALVTIRAAHLDSAILPLQLLSQKARVLFMSNCPLQVERLLNTLGNTRCYFAFPGAGGVHDGQIIRYAMVRQQHTTFGPVRNQPIKLVHEFAALFAQAGFSVDVVPDMEAWLMTHAVLITALCGVLYRHNGVSKAVAHDTTALNDMISGLLEGLKIVAALGYRPSPTKLRLLPWLPRPLARLIFSNVLASDSAKVAINGHANAAPEDVRDLAQDCLTMISEGGRPAPILLRLCEEVKVSAERALRKQFFAS